MKIAILGASRGLGAALFNFLDEESHVPHQFFLASRKIQIKSRKSEHPSVVVSADFTRIDDQVRLIEQLSEFNPEFIFYTAGGGPYGLYQDKEFKDHEWALNLNLLFPMKLVHEILRNRTKFSAVKNIIIVGSKIAGRNPDPCASSYSASKHGLVGFISSIQLELKEQMAFKGIQVGLFEPGYMDTTMLPKHAWPRQQNIVESPDEVARKLWQYSQN